MGGAVRKILFLVETDLDLDLERTCLARPEVRVAFAPPPREPLDTVRRERPDLLVLDAAMAAGPKACRAVKSDAALAATRVLLLAPPTLRREAGRSGADAVVFTPLVRRELLEVARRLVGIVPRRHPRCPVHLRVSLTGEGGELEASGRDLSASGMALCAPAGPPFASVVRLRFSLAEGATEIASDAIVRGPRGGGGAAAGFGVEFDGLAEADRERIARFVSERLSHPVELS